MSVVFWDFDGTLVHSNSLWSKSVLASLREADPNTTVTWEMIRPLMWGSYTWDTPYEDHSSLIGDKWWIPMLEHIHRVYRSCGVPEDVANRATAAFKTVLKRTENYQLYADTVETLTHVKAKGMQNVLLSNNFPELDEVVTALGLDSLLDGIVISAKEGFDKPREELFTIAKARYPSERYYMIGDNPFADILGGNQAGMTTILVHHSAVENADYCFDHLTDILSVVI